MRKPTRGRRPPSTGDRKRPKRKIPRGRARGTRTLSESGRTALSVNPLVGRRRLAQDVAAAPYRLDEVAAAGGRRKLLAQLADEHVDDLEFGLVHPAVEMVEEHFLGQRRALAQREQLEHLIFLAGQMHARAVDLDGLLIEIDDEVAGDDDRLGVTLGAADDRVDARDEFVLVERL